MTDLKILGMDIETVPAKVWTYDLFRPFISHKQIITPSRISCFSYQWKGSKQVKFVSEYHDGREVMIQTLWDLLNEADVVVGYNSKRFDVPWVHGEFLVEGMTAPSPVKHVDLYSVIKQNSRFLSRKLDYVSERLLDDTKIDVNTMLLAIECESDDPEVKRKAWAKMKKYSIKDTRLLFPLFDKLLSYIKLPHPVTDKEGLVCRNCGSDDLHSRGYVKTLQSKYRRFSCNDCGSWTRGTTRYPTGDLRAV